MWGGRFYFYFNDMAASQCFDEVDLINGGFRIKLLVTGWEVV